MKRFLSGASSFAALVALVLAASPVFAGPIVPLKGRGTGQVTAQVNPTPANPVGVQEYVIQGHLTLLGKVTAKGVTFFTADGAVKGSYVATAAGGATIKGT